MTEEKQMAEDRIQQLKISKNPNCLRMNVCMCVCACVVCPCLCVFVCNNCI